MKKDHWNKSALGFIQPYLAEAQQKVQIATGFFTIQGYELIREGLAQKWVQVMVGFDEQSRERLKELLIAEILLHLSRWDAENRRAAVEDLVKRIQQGRFQIIEHKKQDFLDARARNRDHAKIYIFDEATVLVGSSNLTVSGLKYNYEGMASVLETGRVRYYLDQFNSFWEAEDTLDLTQALLDALLAWLSLRDPFDIYLKTIQLLIPEEDVEPPRENYKMPVRYQMVVIERLLRQLQESRGAMLVASTGLGKTVMATHTALRLHRERRIYNVLVFAPVQVQPDWRIAMASAGVGAEIFTRNLLDKSPKSSKGKGMQEMEDAFRRIDDKYLIIIDESQHFRNSKQAGMNAGKKRHAFARLLPIISKSKALVLLLTATPYSKEVDDLNNQLELLPHTAETKHIRPNGQFVLPGMIDEEILPDAWQVQEGPEFFQEFIQLPVATVISTSQVAKDFAEHEEEGDSISFGEEKRWIPQIEISKVKVPVFLEEEISEVIREGFFLHKVKSFSDRKGNWRRSETTIQGLAETSWMSSPLAMQEVIANSMEDSFYKVTFKKSVSSRREKLDPILSKIHSFDLNDDPKFKALEELIKRMRRENRKVIIFTERLSTAIYLEQGINRCLPAIQVANTVKKGEKEYELKDFSKEVLPLIKGFAPVANKDKIRQEDSLTDYQILIATDAYSTGVNLQDASVVINYDLAWTPDVLIQRAGRILRLWKKPRKVYFFTFVGSFQSNLKGKQATHRIEERLRKLSRRSKHAQKFSEIPLIPEEENARFESLGPLSNVTIEDLGLVEVEALEEFSGVSPFLKHITTLKTYEDRAKAIPDDISSARIFEGDKPLLYLLLKNASEYYRILYDPQSNEIQPIKEDALLNMLKCEPDTPLAPIDPETIEKLAQKGKVCWAKNANMPEGDTVERICALYLVPKAWVGGFETLL